MPFIFSKKVVLCLGAALLAAPLASAITPAPDWAVEAAKAPTPASAKDAEAVILQDDYVITIDEKNHAIERERMAVRILKPQGRDWGECGTEYDKDSKLNYLRVWTIDASGKQFQARETDFRDVGNNGDPVMQFSTRYRYVKPPANDPGSVVACESEVHLLPYMNMEDWQIQHSVPVLHESLELILPPGGHYSESWSRYTPVKPVEVASNHLRWEIQDVPAINLEHLHAVPASRALMARVAVMWGDSAVKGAAAQWRAIGQWQDALEAHRPDPTPEITARTQELVAGAPDLYTKLSRITDFIQKNIRYFIVVRGIGGWQAHYAADIFRNRYGDCKDKTTLLISMLQVIGVKAYYLHVDSERGTIDPAAPSLIGNHMITAIELPEGENDARLAARVKTAQGKTLLIFDPTDEFTPVGLINEDLQGAYANIAMGEDSQVIQLPVLRPDVAGMRREGKFTLSADHLLSGEIHENFSGDDAMYQRAHLKNSDSKEIHDHLEKNLGGELPGLTFKSYAYQHQNELDQPLGLELHFSVENYAHAAGPLLLFRPRILGSHVWSVPDVMDGKPRTWPIELGHPGHWHDSFEIKLPDAYAVDELPDPVDMDLDFASYHSKVTVASGVIHYERDYVMRQVELPASRGADFRKLESAILFDEKGTVVLKKQ
jgi:hypothetical protein